MQSIAIISQPNSLKPWCKGWSESSSRITKRADSSKRNWSRLCLKFTTEDKRRKAYAKKQKRKTLDMLLVLTNFWGRTKIVRERWAVKFYQGRSRNWEKSRFMREYLKEKDLSIKSLLKESRPLYFWGKIKQRMEKKAMWEQGRGKATIKFLLLTLFRKLTRIWKFYKISTGKIVNQPNTVERNKWP